VVAETGRLEVIFPGEPLGYEGKILLAGSVRGDGFYGWMSLPNGADPKYRGSGRSRSKARRAARWRPRCPSSTCRSSGRRWSSAAAGRRSSRRPWSCATAPSGRRGRRAGSRTPTSSSAPARWSQVGENLDAPSGAVEIDATGKHVTPGLIDPHTHSGVSSVNESGFAIVPEVVMGDVLTHNNIWFYRQLAGGLTTTMIKHGSANPIGGENVFVKTRWGSLPDEYKIEGAPRTVKFALGENPKRNPNRYPNTRMGVQEIIRDHFRAARDYEKAWKAWEADKSGIPPRKDLRMEALLDILNQELLISSHGYRADEFLALIRLAEEFDFRVQAIQHGVEAYKIASELKEAGVAAVVWSDWGAFKLESYDATSYNARLLLEAGS
jgi:hypothetical protein